MNGESNLSTERRTVRQSQVFTIVEIRFESTHQTLIRMKKR
jgi:hypothetical protein